MARTLLHVGCGRNDIRATTPGFNDGTWDEIRLDIDEGAHPDVVASMTDLSVLEDGSMDAVYSSHNLEHLYPHEVPVALREFLRVLAPDGFCVLTCPDLRAVCAVVAEGRADEPVVHSPAGPITPMDVLYGHRKSLAAGNLFMAHRWGFTEASLRQAFLDSGFGSVITIANAADYALWILAARDGKDRQAMEDLAYRHFPLVRPPGG